MNGLLASGPSRLGPRRVRRNASPVDPLAPLVPGAPLSPEAFIDRLNLPRPRRGSGYRLPLSADDLSLLREIRETRAFVVPFDGDPGVVRPPAAPPEPGMLPSARRVWDAATRAIAQVTDGPYGIPREAFGGMVAQTPAQARGVMGAVRALNEAIIVQGSRSLDAASRLLAAPFAGAVAGISQAAQEMGASRTDARRLERDLTGLMVAFGVATGTGTRGTPFRVPRPNRLLAEADRRGILDRAVRALPPDRRAGAMEQLREAFREGHDAAGEAARSARTAAGTPAASGPGKVVIDLFGGRTSQIPGAINIDRRNQQRLGAQALVPDPRQPAARVRFAPIKDGIADDVFAIGPRAPFLDEAHRILKPGGRLTVVGTRRNEYRHLPDDLTLQNKGFRIIQRDGPLPPELERYTFRFSNDRPIEFGKQFTTILEKVR